MTMRKQTPIDKNLTPMQEKFCIEIVKGDCTQGEAYLRAGFKKTKSYHAAACNLAKKPHVQRRIAEIRAQVEKESFADLIEVRNFLTRTMRQATEEEVLMTEGVERGVTETVRYKKKADLRCALKAADMLVRMSGGYQDNVNLNAIAQVVINDDLED